MALDSRGMSEEELAAALLDEQQRVDASAPTSQERLIHELSVHQIELEMQNRELRSAQAALEESRGKYADLYHLAPIGYCTLARDGRVLDANLRAAELLGTTRGELIGASIGDRVVIENRASLREHLRACLDGVSCAPCVLTVPKRGQRPLFVELVSTPLVDARGGRSACRTTLHDVTAAKVAEQRLSLLAAASELLSSSLDVRATFSSVVKLTAPLLADRAVLDVLAGAQVRSYATDRDEQLTTLSPSSPQASVISSGEPIYGDALICLPLRARGETLGVLTLELADKERAIAPLDIKAAKSLASRIAMAIDNAALYREAQASARAREDVLAMVSHDLKNPLQAIRLNAEYLSRVADPDARRSAGSIRRSIASMQGMIEDLLDLSRIEAGRVLLSRRDFALAAVVADIVDLLEPVASAKDVTLRQSLPSEPVIVHADRGRVLQVLSNLLGNAIKFTEAGGSVSLETTFAEGEARFVIRDTGVGIGRAQLAHVFDRYWQGRAKAQLGSGLGLFIARGLVEAHGGQISIDSELGVGTAVRFSLPNAFAAAVVPRPPSDAAVLIVDDDPEIREVMAAILAGIGYRTTTAANGREALARLRSAPDHPPGLLLIDLQMPVMSGWELCAALKADPQLASIPVVLLSAAADLEEEATSLGTAGCIKKPVDADALVQVIEASYRVDQARVAPSPQ